MRAEPAATLTAKLVTTSRDPATGRLTRMSFIMPVPLRSSPALISRPWVCDVEWARVVIYFASPLACVAV
jgi:hypothetical protein